MKFIKTLLLVVLTVFATTSVYAECTEEQRARLIRDNIPKEIIEEICRGKSPVSKSYVDWRIEQPNGLGFGPSISNTVGLMIFYDRNLGENSQIHIQSSIGFDQSDSLFGASKIETTRSLILGTYRRFFSKNRGFYYGAGAGYSSNQLEYTYTDSRNSLEYEYKAKGSGIVALAEIGYQGSEGFYFHIGFQPALYLTYSDDYNEKKILNISNHRSTANEDWEDSKGITQLSIGFGWFF